MFRYDQDWYIVHLPSSYHEPQLFAKKFSMCSTKIYSGHHDEWKADIFPPWWKLSRRYLISKVIKGSLIPPEIIVFITDITEITPALFNILSSFF